jgi:hypothetical protein
VVIGIEGIGVLVGVEADELSKTDNGSSFAVTVCFLSCVDPLLLIPLVGADCGWDNGTVDIVDAVDAVDVGGGGGTSSSSSESIAKSEKSFSMEPKRPSDSLRVSFEDSSIVSKILKAKTLCETMGYCCGFD